MGYALCSLSWSLQDCEEKTVNAITGNQDNLENALTILLEQDGNINCIYTEMLVIHSLAVRSQPPWDVIELLLKSPKAAANVSFVPLHSQDTILHLAAEAGERIVVELAMARGLSPSVLDKFNRTALFSAAMNDSPQQLAIIELLATNMTEKEINRFDENGDTALIVALRNNQCDAALRLLSHAASVSVRDSDGNTTLHWARDVDCAAEILALNASIVNSSNNVGLTPIHALSRSRGSVLVLEYLIHNTTVNIDTQSPEQRTPLHYAAQSGIRENIEFLVGAGANITVMDRENNTAVMLAIRKQHLHILESFLIGMPSRYHGLPPLHIAVLLGDVNAVQELLHQGIDLESEDGEGRTALRIAVDEGVHDIALYLQQQDADVDQVDNHGLTPLWSAVNSADIASISLLLRMGADILYRIQSTGQPLFFATLGSLKIAKLFLSHGPDVASIRDASGKCALHLVSSANDDVATQTAELLLKSGASVDVIDAAGDTPLILAALHHSSSLVSLFLKWYVS